MDGAHPENVATTLRKGEDVFRHSVGAYFRLFAQEVLSKDAEHAIYMASDVVIMANLQELWKYADSTKIFQWGQRGLCSGFSVINVQKLPIMWEKISSIDLKKVGKRMASLVGDQLVFRAMNLTHPELVGTLPSEWDVSANNGYRGRMNSQYMKGSEEQILPQLMNGVGMLHFNGGGKSKDAYFKTHELLAEHKYDHSFGLVQYYVNIPWTWARFMVESKRREDVAYSPLVVDFGNSPVSSVHVTATS